MELKPCPFCGSYTLGMESMNGFSVVCFGCEAKGPLQPDRIVAEIEWNNRAYEEGNE